MWKAIVLCALVGSSLAKVFWETEDIATESLQRVPSVKTTAEKMKMYLFERSSTKRPRRSLKRAEDVLFVIDSSLSVPEANFTKGLFALKDLVTRFRPSTKFAAILFSTHAEVKFKFVSPTQAMKNLIGIKYDGGYTNTQEALKKSGRLMSDRKSGIRETTYKRMFMLTDGQSNVKKRRTLYLAYLLKEMGVEIFVMAVGDRIAGINELAMLATSTDKHLYRVGEMNQFMQVVKEISNDPYYDNEYHSVKK